MLGLVLLRVLLDRCLMENTSQNQETQDVVSGATNVWHILCLWAENLLDRCLMAPLCARKKTRVAENDDPEIPIYTWQTG